MLSLAPMCACARARRVCGCARARACGARARAGPRAQTRGLTAGRSRLQMDQRPNSEEIFDLMDALDDGTLGKVRTRARACPPLARGTRTRGHCNELTRTRTPPITPVPPTHARAHAYARARSSRTTPTTTRTMAAVASWRARRRRSARRRSSSGTSTASSASNPREGIPARPRYASVRARAKAFCNDEKLATHAHTPHMRARPRARVNMRHERFWNKYIHTQQRSRVRAA